MNDDFVVVYFGCIGRKGIRGVGELRPSIGHRVIGFGQVGDLLHGGVGDRIEEGSHTTVRDEFSTEGDQVKRMALVVHARHLRPRIVDRVVTHQAVIHVRTVRGGHASCNVDQAPQRGDASKTDGFVGRHRRAVTPIALVGVVDLDQTGGLLCG